MLLEAHVASLRERATRVRTLMTVLRAGVTVLQRRGAILRAERVRLRACAWLRYLKVFG
jgi:hypothetical protein